MPGILILVNGLPGTGKSTLAKRLSTDLEYPLLGKDMLKEWLYDNMNVSMKNNAKLLGKSAAQMLYVIMYDFMVSDVPLIVENAFQAAYARDEVSTIIGKTKARCIEIYCATELEENRRRYTERIINGARHPIHGDTAEGFTVNDVVLKKFGALNIGQTIQVDTTLFGDKEYDQLLNLLRKELV
jgi:adenylylsulfate kinase-like enzyme